MAATGLEEALRAGDVERSRRLIEEGADVAFRDKNGDDALLRAVYGTARAPETQTVELLEALVASGAPLAGRSTYGETAIGVLSRFGRFAGLRVLLAAGADPAELGWFPLMRAVAIGDTRDVRQALRKHPASLEERDARHRTPLLLASQTGDVSKLDALSEAGANVHARGRAGETALACTVGNDHAAAAAWLIARGVGVDDRDEAGCTALHGAVDWEATGCVRQLLDAGADPNAECNGRPLADVTDPTIARLLLAAGAHPEDVDTRVLLGLGEPDEGRLGTITKRDFRRDHAPAFGTRNPTHEQRPFWGAMSRAGVEAYVPRTRFGHAFSGGPVWCARRFGQSFTELPDGRVVLVGGEHEDSYDPDFFIYNDVHVYEPDHAAKRKPPTIFGYPEAVFPPTDFHTATLVGGRIVVIGGLGYAHTRNPGGNAPTPVFELSLGNWKIRRIRTAAAAAGDEPGWIHRHRAELLGGDRIRVWGGLHESGRPFRTRHVLHLHGARWEREADA